MNDQLNERIIVLLDYLSSVAKDDDTFARAEIPQVASEIVAWELWSGVLWIIPCIIGCYISYRLCRKGVVTLKSRGVDESFPLFVVCAVVAFFSAIGLSSNGTNILKSIVAPRLVILDYVRSVAK